ncbi:type II secretion system F family protein [Starkeya sp. ORNL1]|uniref:type II secretion system F family protein n=1 Tax=Starkeya sp. ORNL1 TaxID=2709380 RepID=UPI0014644578|nr:type II secretion system F family protein [Starkeya sp. ORNL1]QJP16357.1 type II secretion system F family protein [Starkeya sp. ORNL1]
MANFNYRALTQNGELVSGSIAASSAAEVARRIEFLGLVPVETVLAGDASAMTRLSLSFSRPRPADVTIFTRDLALLLRAGARLDDGLELLADDADLGRLRPVVGKIRADVMAGESFADAIAVHPKLFPAVYVALVRVGEASGTLDRTLELLAGERARAEELRRTLLEALQYPAFVLVAAGGVLVFFLLFVLPQFSNVLRDMGAKLDPGVEALLDLSDLMQAHMMEVAVAAALLPLAAWLVLRRPGARATVVAGLARLPIVRTILTFQRAAVFCRNLGILLGNGVTLTSALRIIVDVMAVGDDAVAWTAAADRVRHGGRLSEAFAASDILPPMAIRMLRLGEETGQLAMLSGRVADFYEAKLQRSLARVVAIIGPLAIVTISVVVGGLIVSVMTALLSVSQSIG